MFSWIILCLRFQFTLFGSPLVWLLENEITTISCILQLADIKFFWVNLKRNFLVFQVENVKRDRLRCLRRSDLRRNQGTLARRFRSQRYRQVSVSISKRRVLRSKFVLYRRWQVSVNFLLATEVHSLKRNYKNSTAFLIFMHYYFQTYSQCAVCIYCTLSFSRCFSFYYLLDL